MVYIDAVRYEKDILGVEAISHLKWTNNLSEQATKVCTKQAMIKFINEHPDCTKTKYLKDGLSWVEGEDVRVVDNSYLRTDSNSTKKDNLGSLPTF